MTAVILTVFPQQTFKTNKHMQQKHYLTCSYQATL